MKLYKLTTKKDIEVEKKDLSVAYSNFNLALLLNPLHKNFDNFEIKIVEMVGNPIFNDWSRFACNSLTAISEIPIPQWYSSIKNRNIVRLRFLIFCLEQVNCISTSCKTIKLLLKRCYEARHAIKKIAELDNNIPDDYHVAELTSGRATADVAYYASKINPQIDFGFLANLSTDQ